MLRTASLWTSVSGVGYKVAGGIEIMPGGAAFLTDERVLVVADMHLGVEATLEYKGLSIPRVQTKKISSYLDRLIQKTAPSKLVVAGDLKHNFSRNLVQEWHDIERFVKGLTGKVSIEVVKGNHDNYLGSILREHKIPLRREIAISEVRILHGHSGEFDGRTTIMGHIHPSLRLRDGSGAAVKDQCFLFDKSRRILILPALSLVACGTDVVGQPSSDWMSPLLSEKGLSGFAPIIFSRGEPLKFPTVRKLREMGQVR